MHTDKQRIEYIINNCVDKYGDIDLRFLDFTKSILPNGEKFKGDIYLDGLKTNGSVSQDYTYVGKNLHRTNCEVKNDLWQNNNIVNGKTYNDFTEHNKIMVFILNNEEWVEDERYMKKLEELTKEQLINRIRKLEKGEE